MSSLKILLPAALALGVLVMLQSQEDAPEVVSAARERAPQRLASADSGWNTLRISEGKTEVSDIFASKSWYVAPPPPPPPKPLPPPKPTAPPLPFTFVGQYKETGAPQPVVILSQGAKVYTVVQGEVIDNLYSVGAIIGNQLELTYIPLGIKQSLNLGVGI